MVANSLIDKRLEIASSPLMSKEDVMLLLDVRGASADKIRKEAIEKFDGSVPYTNRKIKTESVFKAIGLNREEEIANLRKAREAVQG